MKLSPWCSPRTGDALDPLELPEGIAAAWQEVAEHCRRLSAAEHDAAQRSLDFARHQLITARGAGRQRLLAEIRDLEWQIAA